MRRLLLVLVALGALPTATADAVVPIAPADNATTTSTPTFSWQLAAGEEAFAVELSPNPAPGSGGGFAEDTRKRTATLADPQTSYAVGDREPLSPGTWFWHVNVFGPDFDSRWSPVRSIHVPDEPIRLLSFTLDNYNCIRRVGVGFEYADNSVGKPARYRLEFRRRKRGRLVAAVAGRAEAGQHFKAFRVPRRVRRGRFYVRLRVRDAGGHVARSGFRRIRTGRC